MYEVYVLCNYEKGLFSNGYLISFEGSKETYKGEGLASVHEDMLKKTRENTGWVRAYLVNRGKNLSEVIIRDQEMGLVPHSFVPNIDLFFDSGSFCAKLSIP